MKPLWTQTLAWLAAIAAAFLLALIGPDGFDKPFTADAIPQGSTAPR
jgi:hypothetical protein